MQEVNLPGYQPTTTPNFLQIQKAAQAISTAKQPLILAGAGVLFAKASDELAEFAEKYQIPVTNTLLGLRRYRRKSSTIPRDGRHAWNVYSEYGDSNM